MNGRCEWGWSVLVTHKPGKAGMKAGALKRESSQLVDTHAVCCSQQGLSGESVLNSDHFSLFELFFSFRDLWENMASITEIKNAVL